MNAWHQRLQSLAGELVRALREERDFEAKKARDIVSQLGDLLDGDLCEECDTIIPVEDGGSIVNEYHAESCSLYAPKENPNPRAEEYAHPDDDRSWR